jgi:hypothetical protein
MWLRDDVGCSLEVGAEGEVMKYYVYRLARYDMVLEIFLSECFSAPTRYSALRKFWASGNPGRLEDRVRPVNLIQKTSLTRRHRAT